MFVAKKPSQSVVPRDRDADVGCSQCSQADPSKRLNFFFDEEFTRDGAGEVFLAVMPAASNPRRVRPPVGLPSYLAHLWSMPVLNREQEQHCFRKLNYLKYLLHLSHRQATHCAGCEEMLDDVDALQESIVRIRNFLVESNLRLVVSIAKRHIAPNTEAFDELVCIGNAALMRAVDLFDFRRGTRFSTYAYQAVERSIYGVYRSDNRYRSRFSCELDGVLSACSGDAAASDRAEMEAVEALAQVSELLGELDDRDRHIVKARFGIDRPEEGVAFHVIAGEIRLSTTRTVQLYHRSIKKMRSALSQRTADIFASDISAAGSS